MDLCFLYAQLSDNFLIICYFKKRAGRCGAQIVQKKRQTRATRVFGGEQSEIHMCEFLLGNLNSKKSLFPQWEPVFYPKNARNLLEK